MLNHETTYEAFSKVLHLKNHSRYQLALVQRNLVEQAGSKMPEAAVVVSAPSLECKKVPPLQPHDLPPLFDDLSNISSK